MDNNEFLCDHRNTETSHFQQNRFKELYSTMTTFWRENSLFTCYTFFAFMNRALTYLDKDIFGTKPFVSQAWAILFTERVALLAFESYRQL